MNTKVRATIADLMYVPGKAESVNGKIEHNARAARTLLAADIICPRETANNA